MALTWKDLSTAVLALLAGSLYWAKSQGLDLPFVLSNRVIIVTLFLIGIGMCILGSNSALVATMTPWTIIASGLGVVALVITIIGLITGAQIWVTLLTGTIILLWVLSTFRHALGF